MRLCVFVFMAVGLPFCGLAQSTELTRRSNRAKPVTYSASSDWQKVTFRSTARLQTKPAVNGAVPQPEPAPAAPSPNSSAPLSSTGAAAAQPGAGSATGPALRPAEAGERVNRTTRPTSGPAGFRPAFTGDFATNRNGWKAGNKGDYHYQIGLGKYNIRKRNASTRQVAFSYVPLPPDINLNRADTFTIKVDVVADSGRIPTGGVVFGVKDSLNYCSFAINDKGEVAISRVADGQLMSEYMPSDFFAPGVPVDRNRNRLIVRRRRDALHFYVNEQEVRSSPYPFQLFSGNGIGLTTSAYWTSFQKLSVTLGP